MKLCCAIITPIFLASQKHSKKSIFIELKLSNVTVCSILYTRAAQPVARGPHLAREAVLCGPQGLFPG